MARKRPYSPRIREGFFSETGLPAYPVLENSEMRRSCTKNLAVHILLEIGLPHL
jgi:hypothetical protein